jgi:hypothetical protein
MSFMYVSPSSCPEGKSLNCFSADCQGDTCFGSSFTTVSWRYRGYVSLLWLLRKGILGISCVACGRFLWKFPTHISHLCFCCFILFSVSGCSECFCVMAGSQQQFHFHRNTHDGQLPRSMPPFQKKKPHLRMPHRNNTNINITVL